MGKLFKLCPAEKKEKTGKLFKLCPAEKKEKTGKLFKLCPAEKTGKTGKLFMKSTIYPENIFELRKMKEFPVFPWGFFDFVVLLPFFGMVF